MTEKETDDFVQRASEDPSVLNSKELADAIVAAVNAAQGPRQIKIGEYMRDRSPHRHKPALARKFFQNGIMLDREQLSKDAIEMLNVLKPGMYCDGTFRVVPTQDGTKLSALDIRYDNKSIDERMNLKANYPTFEHMLAAMLKEQNETVAA